MALLAYEDSICGGCGQPKDVAYNPDAAGWFETREITCAGCAAQHTEARKDKKPAPGSKTYVIDTRPPDLELMPWSLAGSHPQHDAEEEDRGAE